MNSTKAPETSRKKTISDSTKIALLSVGGMAILGLVCATSFTQMMQGDVTSIFLIVITAFFTLPLPVVGLMAFASNKGLHLPTEPLWISLQYFGMLGRIIKLHYLEITGAIGRIENCLNQVQYKKAEALADRALSLQPNQDPMEQMLFTVLASMAAIVQCKLNNYDRALQLIEKHISPAWERFNSNRSQMLANDMSGTVNTVGCVFDDLNRPKLALQCYEHTLSLKRFSNTDDLTLATANVGYAHLCLGNFEQSEQFLRETVAEFQRQGKLNSDMAIVVSGNLAECLLEQNKLEEAATLIWDAVARGKKAWHPDYPSRSRALVTAARILAREGKDDEAKNYFEEALTVCSNSVTLEHLDAAYVMQHYAVFLRTAGDTARAEQLESASANTLAKLARYEVPLRLLKLVSHSAEELVAEALAEMTGIDTASGAASIKLAEKGKDGMHPDIAEKMKIYGNNLISYGLIAYIGFLLFKSEFHPASLGLLVVLAGLLLVPRFMATARLRRANELIYGGQNETAVVRFNQAKQNAMTPLPHYSGTIEQSSISELQGKKLNFEFPSPGTQPIFNDHEINVNVFTDPKSKKVIALNTAKGLVLVNNEFLSNLNPMTRLLVTSGTTVSVVFGAFLLMSLTGIYSPPKTIPEGKTAQEYYDLGVRYKDAGWTELSRDSLNRSIKLEPQGVGKKADLFKRTRLPRRPVSKEAVMMNIKGFNRQGGLGKSEAEEIWKECIKKYPDFEWPYSNLGSLYLEQNRLEEADKLLSKAIELNPDYINALLFEAEVKRKQKKFDEANVLLDKVLSLEPDNSKAKVQKMLPRI